MNKDQVDSHPRNEDEKAREAARKAAEGRGKEENNAEKQGGNNAAVLGDINDDAGKAPK
ncbi:hypothetical protein K8B33_15685 [Alcanivorax sp. JB21]|uniref:hypothetical protein n=1 Tax=Alcanivorax limicola TaxID=2874102 RepID=UPI001CBB3384|nr:hypothetical protein [Alcanivorax limicola]MBZ2190551.1 hypothetical protein [Alcanivorax limicola]